jgi:inosine/xanthosine triphosphatase
MARVCMGGTFDVIHRGHRALLSTAFEVGDEGVFVGVTSDEMASSMRDRDVRSHEERAGDIRAFAEEHGWADRAEVAPIDDPVGRALEPVFDTIVVSTETQGGAQHVNRRRRERGREPLDVVVAPLVLAEDGRRISATRIREGAIDAHGTLSRPLRAVVGTGNPVKERAAEAAIRATREGEAAVEAADVATSVPDQPRGARQTTRGALERAVGALADDAEADWGVGIEAGLVEAPGWGDPLDVQVVAVVDRGGRASLGQGPGFAYPRSILAAVEGGATVGTAVSEATGIPEVGEKQGAIGVLSEGAMDRTRLTEDGVLVALVPRLHPDEHPLPRVDDLDLW